MPVRMTEQKVREIADELRKTGFWKKHPPGWVSDYEQKLLNNEQDFLEWLQFVYLPNCNAPALNGMKNFIVPQAVKFFGSDVKKGKLLQLLIELDSLL
jgi:uncharacterized protein YqcC (DUF446 family)